MFTWKQKQALEYIQSLDENTLLQVKELRETRSQAQNRLYWQRLWLIREWFAEKWILIHQNDLHEWFKEKFIKTTYRVNKLTKKRYKQEKTTTNLDKKEFSQYLKDIDSYLYQMFEMIVLKPTELIDYN